MDLQPYSHNCFSKISRTLFDFLNNTSRVSLFLEKQLANIPDRGFLFLRNTLLLYSLSPYWRTEWQTETQIHLLRMGWRNLFSSRAVVSCQFLVLAGNRFLVYILMYLEYGVVLVFWLRREIVIGVMYILSVRYSSVMSKYEHHLSHFNLRKFLLGFFFLQNQWDQNFSLLCISFLLCTDLQPCSLDCFSKISRTLFDFLNNTSWVFFF